MAKFLQNRSEPWEFDPTCTKVTYETPTGEVIWTEIKRPKVDVERELAERAKSKLNAWKKIAYPVVSGALATTAILLVLGLRPL
jgi:hypothetical protein